MGTSKSIPTPSGGAWRPLKNDITAFLGGDNVTPDKIIGGTLIAAGGIAASPAFPSRLSGRTASRSSAGGTGSAAGRRRGRGRVSDGGNIQGRSSVSRVVSGLGSFGAAVAAEGLDGALRGLGLAVLQGRPAAEVVARIAEHISEGVDGMQGEILATALREAIFEAATLEGDLNYENLDKSLQDFLSRDGAEGLVELFLTHYVFERVWSIIESHVDRKSNTDADAEAEPVNEMRHSLFGIY